MKAYKIGKNKGDLTVNGSTILVIIGFLVLCVVFMWGMSKKYKK
ncbi:hypothetical protein HMPREF9413_0210 [Paenibacillus sp. HGF7]|nr:hypothetical protein HMPREF9413_0210 [Paenibacillus sp. HGF7]